MLASYPPISGYQGLGGSLTASALTLGSRALGGAALGSGALGGVAMGSGALGSTALGSSALSGRTLGGETLSGGALGSAAPCSGGASFQLKGSGQSYQAPAQTCAVAAVEKEDAIPDEAAVPTAAIGYGPAASSAAPSSRDRSPPPPASEEPPPTQVVMADQYRPLRWCPVDHALAGALKSLNPDALSRIGIERMHAGKYVIDGRTVTLRRRTTIMRGFDTELEVCEEGVLGDPKHGYPTLPQYLQQVADVLAMLLGSYAQNASAIVRLPKEKRLTFKADSLSSMGSPVNMAKRYTSMLKACEARLRAEAAAAYESSRSRPSVQLPKAGSRPARCSLPARRCAARAGTAAGRAGVEGSFAAPPSVPSFVAVSASRGSWRWRGSRQ